MVLSGFIFGRHPDLDDEFLVLRRRLRQVLHFCQQLGAVRILRYSSGRFNSHDSLSSALQWRRFTTYFNEKRKSTEKLRGIGVPAGLAVVAEIKVLGRASRP